MAAEQTKTESDVSGNIVFHGELSELYYFAYGSDMNRKQILLRCAKPVEIGVAKLARSRMEFYGHSKTWDGGEENVVSDPDQEVWGVLYKLTLSDWERLDGWQDVRLDGSGAYYHYPARVIDTEGTTHTVLFYKKSILGAVREPSREYLDFIIQGAAEHGLPTGYIEGLGRMQSRKAKYDVPRRKKINLGSRL